MSVLLQISDTHFGTERPHVVEALVNLAAQQRPDVVVLSGDITQRARPAQFRAARAFADRLAAPVLAVPGNHDIPLFDLWTRLRRPYAHCIAAFDAELEPVHRLPDLLVVCVNTTRAWRHKHGEMSGLRWTEYPGCWRTAGPHNCEWWSCISPWPRHSPKTCPTLCAGMPQRCSAGQPPAPTLSWVGISICPA